MTQEELEKHEEILASILRRNVNQIITDACKAFKDETLPAVPLAYARSFAFCCFVFMAFERIYAVMSPEEIEDYIKRMFEEAEFALEQKKEDIESMLELARSLGIKSLEDTMKGTLQ